MSPVPPYHARTVLKAEAAATDGDDIFMLEELNLLNRFIVQLRPSRVCLAQILQPDLRWYGTI